MHNCPIRRRLSDTTLGACKMKVSYRVTSSVFVISYVLVIASQLLVNGLRGHESATVDEVGVAQFDPCTMWEQMPATVVLSSIVWFVSFVILLVQGLRNRSAPRWLAITCLVALGPTVNHNLSWRLQHCYTKVGRVGFWICVSAVGLMCLHQILQRPVLVKMNRPSTK